jgi:hypothetical protein
LYLTFRHMSFSDREGYKRRAAHVRCTDDRARSTQ